MTDRLTVALFSLAAFLLTLAFLSWQLAGQAPVARARPRELLLRRVYTTTVIERVPSGARAGSSVSQSVSTQSPSEPAGTPVTRAS